MKTGKSWGTAGQPRDLKLGDLWGWRQIEGRGRYVRGEMMHKWNKDERIESLNRETEA